MIRARKFTIASAALFMGVAGVASAQLGKPLEGLQYPNSAKKEDMVKLANMTPELADKIIAARPHKDMLALDKLVTESIADEAKRKELYVKFFEPINLDWATPEEILLVPNVGTRMPREFAEYRPYEGGMEEFNREIGKYVRQNPTELPRLAQYVFAPIDLNSATDEFFKTIPALDDKVLAAIKAAKPYTSLEQFRTEVGKAADAKEVGRIERYIYIKGVTPAPTAAPRGGGRRGGARRGAAPAAAPGGAAPSAGAVPAAGAAPAAGVAPAAGAAPAASGTATAPATAPAAPAATPAAPATPAATPAG